MSKPDSTGESLESILASIRRSLAEQSTGVLEDETAAPAALYDLETGAADDADIPRLFGGTGAAQPDAPTGERELLARLEEDPPPPSALAPPPVQEEPPPPAPAGVAAPQSLEDPPPPAPVAEAAAPLPGTATKDPFWFLSARGEMAKKDSGALATDPDAPLRPSPASPNGPAEEQQAVRADIVRGPLPPFFGSSAEAAEVPGVSTGAGVMPPARASDRDPLRSVLAEAPRAAAWPPEGPVPAGAPVPPAAREGAPNGKASLFPGPAPAATTETSAQLRGLEAMVAELLRPMLRRWLDENMPRLVSAALKAEADLIAKRDHRKP